LKFLNLNPEARKQIGEAAKKKIEVDIPICSLDNK
jgi:hypothetical protein